MPSKFIQKSFIPRGVDLFRSECLVVFSFCRALPRLPHIFFFFFPREIGGNVEKITSRLQRRLHEAQVELLLCPVEGGPFFFISGSRECLDLCKTRTRHFVVRAGARSHLQWYTFTTVERGDKTAHLDSLFARSLGPITGRYQFPLLVTVVEVNS